MERALQAHRQESADSRPPAPAEKSPTIPADRHLQAAVTAPALAPGDRRQETRREPDAERAFAPLDLDRQARRWLPGAWPWQIIAMLLSIAVAMGAAESWPGPAATASLIVATACIACIGIAHRSFDGKGSAVRLLGAMAVVVAPLFMFGFGLTQWAENHSLAWELAIALLLGNGVIASVYLRRQPGMIFAAQGAIWSAAVLSYPTWFAIGGLMIALVLAVLVGREQISQQSQEESLRAARERAQTRARDILADYENTQQGWFWETDRRSQLTYLSEPVARALGREPDGMIGQSLVHLFDLLESGDAGERTLMFHLSTRSAFKELAVRAAIDKEERWWSISGRPIHDEYDNFVGFRGSGTDLTERKRSEEEATRLANFDSLTGLANRFQITSALDKVLTSKQIANRDCAIFLLDLDRFKHVNDTMGHPAGDALLRQVSQRLERAIGQLGQVGRLGGDEFKVLIPGAHKKEDMAAVAREVIHSLSQPYAIDGQRVVIGASIGIAMAPENGETGEELVRNADLALYAAKDGGRGRFHFYAQDLHAEAEARSQMEEDLRDAIAKGDLQLFYQPVISSADEKISGFEALLRWHHPVKGWIPPDRFIKIAEDTGMITQLGDWALRTACSDLALMPEKIRMAVNVSPLQFSNPKLPAVVTNAIAHAGIAPDQLELEITESVFLSDDEGTDMMFKALKRIGVRLALDDFGTGYSSLGYLKKAPFDKIKIDQSFVRGATQDGSRNGAIIASITSLAHALGMETTAEGVETLDELDLVRMHGCSHIQGYIYERALSRDDAITRLEAGLEATAIGPRAARAPRQTMLRKVVLEHSGNLYDGTIRNISTTGAMIEGLWNVPPGTIFNVQISQDFQITCTARWCDDDKMGVEFASPLHRDRGGRISAVQGAAPNPVRKPLVRNSA